MTRRFDSRPVEEPTLARILDPVARLPTAGFSQGVDVLVLTAQRARERFWASTSESAWRDSSPQAPGLLAAPVILVPIADPQAYLRRYGEPDKAATDLAGRLAADWTVPYWLVDASFAVLAILLAAEAEGLGALFFRLHGPPSLLFAELEVPAGRAVIGAIALGHRRLDDRSSGSPTSRQRRDIAQMIHRDAW